MSPRFATAPPSKNRIPDLLPALLVGILCVGASVDARAQTTSWEGDVSSDWRTSGNWSSAIPDSSTNTTVSIDSTTSGRSNLVVPAPLSGDTARVGDLLLQSGGRMLFASAPSPGYLIIHGSVLSLNGGVLQLGDGSILFKDDVQLNGGGQLFADNGTMEFQGDIDAQGGYTFDPGTGTVVLSGNGAQTISGDIAFYNLVVEPGVTLSISGSVSVVGTVTVESGATLNVVSGGDFQYEGEYLGGGEVNLPVQLTRFSASIHGTGILLQWSTATEEHNFGFTVERRTISDNGAPWSQLGFVPGAGTSTSPREYSFLDPNQVAGRYAYRLVQIDRDGATETFHEAEVQVLPPDATGLLSIYPNPFNPQTTIGYSLATDTRVRLSVFDVTGREIAVLVNETRPAGMYQVEWIASHVPSGTYFARMESDGRGWTMQLLLLK